MRSDLALHLRLLVGEAAEEWTLTLAGNHPVAVKNR